MNLALVLKIADSIKVAFYISEAAQQQRHAPDAHHKVSHGS